MDSVSKWLLTDAEKDEFIATLTPNLPALRTQAEISQEELANLLGISRQTYSAIELKVRKMAWRTYLSLVLFFDYNQKTHKMLRMLSLFSTELITRFNDGVDYSSFAISSILGNQTEDILEVLDEQAKQAINSMIMVEYARCTKLPSEAVVKSFGGANILNATPSAKDVEATLALKAIQNGVANEE